jgi:hypothetical protein
LIFLSVVRAALKYEHEPADQCRAGAEGSNVGEVTRFPLGPLPLGNSQSVDRASLSFTETRSRQRDRVLKF